MPNKILLITFILVSSFTLSSCRFDQAQTQLTDKITSTASATLSEETVKPTIEPTLTDLQIETELNSGAPIDVDLEADFANLEKELEQL